MAGYFGAIRRELSDKGFSKALIDGLESWIKPGSVALGDLGSIPTQRLIGRFSAIAGSPELITVSASLSLSGVGELGRSAITGDVNVPAGSNTATIPSDTVTYAKMQNVSAASKLLGRGDSGSGDPQEIELGTGLTMIGTTLTFSLVGAAVSAETGTSYTAVLADANTYIRFSNAGAITFTIPPNSSVAFPVGTVIEMEQAGAGALSVAAGSGVTINSRSSDLTLAGQYAVAFVKKVATDTWTMNGDL